MPARKPPPSATAEAEREQGEVPVIERTPRTPKLTRLESQIQSIYIMIGGAMAVVPPQMAGERLRAIGRSFSIHSGDIAEAWIDLAEEDARVRKAWESLTGFSSWGKVVGRHLEAIGDETPGIRGARQQQQQAPEQSDDLAAMMAIADFFTRQQAAARQQPQGNGEPQGPSQEQVRRAMQEQERQQQRPQRQQQQQPVQQPPQQAPPMGTSRKPVGMPTPADLGVTFADTPEDFPAAGEADVKG